MTVLSSSQDFERAYRTDNDSNGWTNLKNKDCKADDRNMKFKAS
jgi:hypothetical protein